MTIIVFRESSEKKEERERVRAALLRAALHLGAAHGFASLGLREVAREAGIAPTSFYRHFADMEELGVALSRELVGDVVEDICARVRASGGAWATVLVDGMLEACARDPELMRFFVSERVGSSRALRVSLQSQQTQLVQGLRSAMSKASAAELPPAELPPSAVDAMGALVLDACARALEDPAAATPAPDRASSLSLRDACVWAIEHLLTASGVVHAEPAVRSAGRVPKPENRTR